MEGPTPVSALIHAATMVTAGVYVVARSHILFEHSETARVVVAVIGCATALFAATIGLVQTDIKRVLAYSTVSQLGYMFLACGVGAFSAGIFHLMTHAFFKALLFLAAGSVIHAMGGEQDMRHMGGLRKKIKYTFVTMFIATLAIAGIPPLAGFFSKDSILFSAYNIPGGHPLYFVGSPRSSPPSMFRLVFLTFWGQQRYDGITSTSTNRREHAQPAGRSRRAQHHRWLARRARSMGRQVTSPILTPIFASGEGANP
jgi:NADH-quinone oxidoreductase subunit L